jgi:hypothetical protein
MKYFITMLSLFATIILSDVAQATPESPWQGVQIKTAIHGEVGLGKNVALRGTAAHLAWPSKNINATFAYLGTKIELGERIWFAPQAGFSTGFLGEEWGIGSLWMGAEKKRFSLFLEGDIYFRQESQLASYAFGSLDFSPIPKLTFGAHTEGINDDFTIGGHIDWHTKECLTFSLQSFTNPVNGSTNLRVVTNVFAF